MIPIDRIVLATANQHKALEITELLASVLPGCEVLPRPSDIAEVIEDADSFLGNARLKARALVDATGDSAIADDSGLVVDALGGAPGVHSARYAGEGATDRQNVKKLLSELDSHGATTRERRMARFVCVIVFAQPHGHEVVARGEVEGVIVASPSGTRGFGYDPVFEPLEGFGRTFADMSPEEKGAISHRGRALRSLVTQLV